MGALIEFGDITPARIDRAFRAAAEAQMRVAMNAIHAETVRRAPYRTGHLRRSIATVVSAHGNTIVGTIGTTVFYAPYLEMGTGLYGPRNQKIVPKNARALRFPGGGSASLFSGGSRTGGSAGPGFRLSGQQRSGAAGNAATYLFRRSVKGIHPRKFFADSQLIGRGIATRAILEIPLVAQRQLRIGR